LEHIVHARWLWLVPVLPLIGAFINGAFGLKIFRRYGETPIHSLAIMMPAASFFITAYYFWQMLQLPAEGRSLCPRESTLKPDEPELCSTQRRRDAGRGRQLPSCYLCGSASLREYVDSRFRGNDRPEDFRDPRRRLRVRFLPGRREGRACTFHIVVLAIERAPV